MTQRGPAAFARLKRTEFAGRESLESMAPDSPGMPWRMMQYSEQQDNTKEECEGLPQPPATSQRLSKHQFTAHAILHLNMSGDEAAEVFHKKCSFWCGIFFTLMNP